MDSDKYSLFNYGLTREELLAAMNLDLIRKELQPLKPLTPKIPPPPTLGNKINGRHNRRT